MKKSKKKIQTVFTNIDSIIDFEEKHGRSMTNYERSQYAKGKWDGQKPIIRSEYRK